MGCNVKKARISWPSDSMLCQVKMFETEDCPAKVGTQSRTNNPKVLSTDLPWPPNISLITWKRPPQFIINEDLLVASGGESTETGSENLRIAKVLEALYPHPSLVPTGPFISPAVQGYIYADCSTPNIRLTPIEDDDDDQTDSLALQSSHCSNLAAASALLKPMEQEEGSLVDAGLLVKFLTDPIIVNNLLNNNTPPQLVPTQPTRVEDALKPNSVDDVFSEPQCQSSLNGAYQMNKTRDEYFKNLIREHGGVVAPATNGTNNYKGRVDSNDKKKKALVKAKGQKPCMFFGRGRGCKLGESCLYLHDPSKRVVWTDAPRAKRLKF